MNEDGCYAAGPLNPGHHGNPGCCLSSIDEEVSFPSGLLLNVMQKK
jgi:hypothetical protein